jgi:DNA-directed RNA polymerase subunit beta
MVYKKPEERFNFSKMKEPIDIPNLIEIQQNSYFSFLQMDVQPDKRKNDGLQKIFNEIFPIKSYDGNISLEFVSYVIGVPKYNIIESSQRGLSFSGSLRVKFRLVENEQHIEEEVYLGNIPLMTERGTFIINGAERVIVNQLHRSPGICFEKVLHPRGTTLYSFRIIPYRGSWLEVQFDVRDLLYLYVDRRRRRRKILVTTFLRALGYSTNEEILKLFFDSKQVDLEKIKSTEEIEGLVLAQDVVMQETSAKLGSAGTKMEGDMIKNFMAAGIKKVSVLKDVSKESTIIKMLSKEDPATNQEAALKEIYRKLRPGDPPTVANAKNLIKKLFFDEKRYNLGSIGRYKLNQKLGRSDSKEDIEIVTLKTEDIIDAIKFLIDLKEKRGKKDDIDHLGSRRVRSVGELLQNQCRIALARMERMIKERMNLYDVTTDKLTPHKLINPKGFASIIKDFFGRGQLSQFMDQTNPLAELTHKRRLSALGPGGLNRERAGFEVRDVHSSHYGRVCPIETPEGPNIGLITSLSTYAKINEFGFVQAPYRKVENKRVTDEIKYLTADVEENYVIAQANAHLDAKGNFIDEIVDVRFQGDFMKKSRDEVQFMDVSPLQLVSVSAGMIPFLEHDDANRALMGSNMQRQAVPLLFTESPLIGTGLEKKVAMDSGVLILSGVSGTVTFVDASRVVINDEKEYVLRKYIRSNTGTCITQKPVVKMGQKIKKGDVLADGQCTDNGEMALGRNVLAAFMPWGGYNFEDAILVSENLVKEDKYTSIHIEEYEVSARDTKLGKEEITRDIPNVSTEALKNLGEDGIIRIGAEVKPGDILVGKITPKSETELSPEERLLRAIFGEKASDVRDASLRAPSGTEGIVMDVQVFSRKNIAKSDSEKKKEKEDLNKVNEDYKKNLDHIKIKRHKEVEELLIDRTLDADIIDSVTKKVILEKGEKIKKADLKVLKEADYKNLYMAETSLTHKLESILMKYERDLEALEMRYARDVEFIKKGDELEPGVIKQVKAYIACKRTLSVGDKVAGRHGNKGVIAKILPEEDMPFLPDGTPVDFVLNPLGVPSRMNVGQVLETHLGWAAKVLGLKISVPVFGGVKEDEIFNYMKKAKLPEDGKIDLYDGRTGEKFEQKVVVGYIYILKLNHLVAEKIHARAVGPYSLVTQQPLGGKAQYGGQRFGEMEVWALEAYGAAYTLQELLTVKSDDVQGRTKIYESIVKGDNSLKAGTPESFNVLMKEIQSLALDIRTEKSKKL